MNNRAHIEDCLRRIEERAAGLEKITDPAARQIARQLFEAVLGLHGLALAKITARLAISEEGRDIYSDLGDDEQVKAVLLLYGLHPRSAEERVRDTVKSLEERLGVRILVESVGDGIARVTLDPGIGDFDTLCPQIGQALIDAAPDLDDIAIDRPAIAMTGGLREAAAG